VGVPVPADYELPEAAAEAAITQATEEAEVRGIHGKAVTPFVLARVAELTGDASKRANTALLVNNARVAALIAAEIVATFAR
jgi:pseudouridine-5'-phosphate glycosidase